MDKLKKDFEAKAFELCAETNNYKVLEKKIKVLDIDETPAYGLETKLKIGISGVVECKQNYLQYKDQIMNIIKFLANS